MAEFATKQHPRARKKTTPEQGGGVNQAVFSPSFNQGVSSAQAGWYSSSVQRKVDIGQADDPYEREADDVADYVTGHADSMPAISSIGDGCSSCGSGGKSGRHSGYNKGAAQRKMNNSAASNRQSTSDSESTHTMKAKNAGNPLGSAVRKPLESATGQDLSHVRIHNDHSAQNSAKAMNARAFTHGHDIWLGKGESENDLGLMAHEATHVVQQSGGNHGNVIQRQRANAPATTTDEYTGNKGAVNKRTKEISLPVLKVPTFKLTFTPGPLTLPKKTDEARPDDQRQVWETAAREGTGFNAKLDSKLVAERSPRMTSSGQPIFYLKLKQTKKENFVFGNRTAIRNRSLRPFWDPDGRYEFYDVDHQKELQLGGDNLPNNMWLLQSEANQSSGRNIRNERNSRISALLNAATGTLWDIPPDVDEVRRQYTIRVNRVIGGLPVSGNVRKRYTIEQIRDRGTQLDGLQVLTKQEIEQAGLQGGPSQLVIYTNETGGGIRRIDWGEGIAQKNVDMRIGQNFIVQNVRYSRGEGGKISGIAFRATEGQMQLLDTAPLEFDIIESEAVDYGGYVSAASVTRAARSALKMHGLSPIEMTQAELSPEKGLVARGKVLPTLPLFKDLDIDIVVDGNNVYLSKRFSAGDFDFPGPISVTGSSLEIFAGTQGLGFAGEVLFEIERIGKGKIAGAAATGTGQGGSVALEGEFEFDTELFDPAKVNLWYREQKFGGSGELGIKSGKVKGIKSANIRVGVDGETWDANGTVEPEIRGIRRGTLAGHYEPEKGFEISGTLEFSNEIPGVRGGSIEATVLKKEEGEGYKVKASGNLEFGIEGIGATIQAEYDDGLFKAEGTVGYERGMLKGSITAGVTNQQVNAEGQPTGEPSNAFIVYGGGTITLRLAPWLSASAGVKLLPNGEIEVVGSIGLPAALEIFPEKRFDKNLLSIHLDIPIIGVAVAGQRIGIFATIGGGLDLSAGVGPGQLRELGLSVTYNPAHEEDTHVRGGAELFIPARAGLRLFVTGALGVGIPIVSATAGLEVGGQLGVEGALRASVQVDWSPRTGLELNAEAEIFAEPVFKFDITGFVKVEADLLITTIELYEKRWELASMEFGSGLRLGMRLPIHYKEGEPFEPSINDIEFTVPEIKPKEVLENLVDRIT